MMVLRTVVVVDPPPTPNPPPVFAVLFAIVTF
jgi:hypothetical protein